jgi:hypothetical protein
VLLVVYHSPNCASRTEVTPCCNIVPTRSIFAKTYFVHHFLCMLDIPVSSSQNPYESQHTDVKVNKLNFFLEVLERTEYFVVGKAESKE